MKQEFTFSYKTNANSGFKDIDLNFGGIENIIKNTENKFDTFLTKYDSEIIRLLGVVDINQLIFDPEYITKILMKKLERILTFEEFKLYFKLEKKKGKINESENLENNVSADNLIKKERQKKNKEKEKEKKEQEFSKMNDKLNQKPNEVDNININIGLEKNIENKSKDKNENNIGNIQSTNEVNNKTDLNKINEPNKENENEIIEDKSENENKSKNILSSTSANEENISITPENLKYDKKENNDTNFFSENIMNELNSNNEEITIDGKDYESKVRSFFKMIIDYSSDQNLKIESNSGCSIKFIYKSYEELIKKDITKKNERILGNQKTISTAEFDIIIKNLKKSTILKILKKFEGNIICKGNIGDLDEKKEYQIIGEVAKNILHQAPDKLKQISKYIDIILINEILKNTKIKQLENIKRGFEGIDLDFNSDKILMIISDGSFIKLLNAYNFDDKDEVIDKDTTLTDREKKNIKCFKKIIKLLNDSGIPYFIFFMPSDLKDQIDDYLIEHIKAKTDNDNKLKKRNNDKEKIIQNNMYLSYYIKSFYSKIDNFKSNILDDILQILEYDFKNICQSLYGEIIEKLQPKNEIIFESIIFQVNEDVMKIKILSSFLENYNFIKYQEKKIKNNIELIQYIDENKKIYDNVFRNIIFNYLGDYEIKFRIDNEQYFSSMINIKEFKKNFDDFKKKFELMIYNFFSQKIKNFVNKNFLYYSTNKEYLNRKNLINKIIYDLKKLNYSITFKKMENNEFNMEKFNQDLKWLKSIDLVEKVKLLYNSSIDAEIKNILNISDEHFESIKENKDDVLEEYLCWGIYKYFFCEYLVKKICNM